MKFITINGALETARPLRKVKLYKSMRKEKMKSKTKKNEGFGMIQKLLKKKKKKKTGYDRHVCPTQYRDTTRL